MDKTDSIETALKIFALQLICSSAIYGNFFYQTLSKNALNTHIACQIMEK